MILVCDLKLRVGGVNFFCVWGGGVEGEAGVQEFSGCNCLRGMLLNSEEWYST